MAKAHELDYNLPQLTVGEIAHVFGVSEQTVRFYHKKGLLVPDTRGDNAYRKYSWNKLSVLAQICKKQIWARTESLFQLYLR